MYFLLNDIILDIEPARMLQPLEAQKFESLNIDYIKMLGQEIFAEEPMAHKGNVERVRRLCYLINLKMPNINAAQFSPMNNSGNSQDVSVDLKSLHSVVLEMMYQEQSMGQLDPQKIDTAVWHRLAA